MLSLREALLRAGFNPLLEKASNVTPGPTHGIDVSHWFWASLAKQFPIKKQVKEESPEPTTTTPTDAELGQMLVDNPTISGATLLNLLKAQGWSVVKKEADSASANVQVTRPSVSESNKITIRTRLIESSSKDNGIGATKFRVVLLQEGLGNLRDLYFYSKDALISAISIFEGKKIYADHPSTTEEESRPERSVKDILGHFDGLTVEEDENGQSQLVGNVNILPDKPYEWARAVMRHSVEYSKQYPDKEFVGLSINAEGESSEVPINKVMEAAPDGAKVKLRTALEQGVESVRLVSKITDAISCDLVTEAGAGGKILQMLEADQSKGESKMADQEQPASKTADSMGAHDDEQQDIALIKKMLDQYMGEGKYGEEEVKQAHEAVKCAMKQGEEKDKAVGLACSAMKMAKYMASEVDAPKPEAEEEDCECEGEETCEKCKPAPKESEEKKESEETEESEEGKKQESAKDKEIITLKGQLAALMERAKKRDIEDHLEKVLKESGLSMSVTKQFRSAVGTPKSVEEIDSKFALFCEGRKTIESGEALDYSSIMIQPEKVGETFKNDLGDFNDCLK